MLFPQETKKEKRKKGKVVYVSLLIDEEEKKITILKVAASKAENGTIYEAEKDSKKEFPLNQKTLATLLGTILEGAEKLIQKNAVKKEVEKDEN